MGHRSYRQRCEERRFRLLQRANFLAHKIETNTETESVYERMEESALRWALEQIELFATIEEALASDLDDSEKVHAIGAVIATRLHPSKEDLVRNPGLRKTMQRQRAARPVGVEDDHVHEFRESTKVKQAETTAARSGQPQPGSWDADLRAGDRGG